MMMMTLLMLTLLMLTLLTVTVLTVWALATLITEVLRQDEREGLLNCRPQSTFRCETRSSHRPRGNDVFIVFYFLFSFFL